MADDVIFPKKTQEEMDKENEKTTRDSSIFVRIIRIIRDNPDLLLLTLIIFSSLIAGYYVCCIKMGLTVKEVQTQLTDFIAFVVSVFTGILALIGRLHVPEGTISKTLSKRTIKDSDIYGRSIIK